MEECIEGSGRDRLNDDDDHIYEYQIYELEYYYSTIK